MGILDIFKNGKNKNFIDSYFKQIIGYAPAFTSYNGGLYEMDLTRSAIHTIARSVSKLDLKITGAKYKGLDKKWTIRINEIMTLQQFLYKSISILLCENNVLIIPIYNDAEDIVGLYPLSAQGTKIVEYNGEKFIRFTFGTEQKAMPLSKVGFVRNFYCKKEFYGEDNRAFAPTMELMNTQNQGIVNGIKQGAEIRFLAKINQVLKETDIAKMKQRFVEENLSKENNSGMMFYDNKIDSIQQVDSKPFIINDKQAEQIRNNVYNYFGVNEKIIQNKFSEEEWNAFYEGLLEPISIQLSQVITGLLFNEHEIMFDNFLMFTTNRLQYASASTKLNVVTQLFDRGFMTHNQGNDIFQLPKTPDGDKYYIRKEYAEVTKLDKEGVVEHVETGTEGASTEEGTT